MNIKTSPRFFDELGNWVHNDKRIAAKIIDLVKVTAKTPFEGIGKPEPLKHGLSGL